MSHAANLRARPRPSLSTSESPTKRRKVQHSPSSNEPNGAVSLANGPLPHKRPVAFPSVDAKQKSLIKSDAPGVAHIRSADAGDLTGIELEDESARTTQQDDKHGSDSDETTESDSGQEPDIIDDATSLLQKHGEAALTSSAMDTNQATEPSFGDLLRDRNLDTVIVEPSVHDPPGHSAVVLNSTSRALSLPSATSLGTVLTQALKTNDHDLLESCLQVSSLDSIRATVQRLHPSLAATLLQRLAERLHKRPGRAGSLMVWVQWTIVAHGGYLASQPAAMKEIQTLYQVVKQRATGLQPLLALKGRLDMLEAQLQMRRNLKSNSRSGKNPSYSDAAVIYVEGDDDETSEVEADFPPEDAVRDISDRSSSRREPRSLEVPDSDEEDGHMPISVQNEDTAGEADEDLSESDGDDAGFYDEEAEETDNDIDDLSEDIDYDDSDEADEQDESLQSEEEEEGEEGEDLPVKRPIIFKRGGPRPR